MDPAPCPVQGTYPSVPRNGEREDVKDPPPPPRRSRPPCHEKKQLRVGKFTLCSARVISPPISTAALSPFCSPVATTPGRPPLPSLFLLTDFRTWKRNNEGRKRPKPSYSPRTVRRLRVYDYAAARSYTTRNQPCC